MLQHHGPQHGKTWGRWVQCSSTSSPPLHRPHPHSLKCRAAVVGKAQCERESGFTAEAEKLLDEHLGGWEKESWGSGSFVGGHILEAVGWEGILQWSGQASPTPHTPHHFPLKSKCRGTSPGRSGSVAQCLSRQAVTALGCSPARLHGPLLAQAHPVWNGLTKVRQPTPSGQTGAPFLWAQP